MYVIYKNDKEVLICTKKKEEALKEEYFLEGADRDLDDYDRSESSEAVICITSRVYLD